MEQKIKRALISVSDKSGLEELATALVAHGVELVSSGGTARFLQDVGLAVIPVEELTGFPEILDGRVKTLHPKVHGALLARPQLPDHAAALAAHDITPIELVVVNLYPFEETIARTQDQGLAIEMIDIGGPAMIRAAAKNHENLAVVVTPSDYPELLREFAERSGATDLALRQRLAAKAFSHTAAYDSAIAAWMAGQFGQAPEESQELPASLTLSARRVGTGLRYGENPHQRAALYLTNEAIPSAARAQQLQGKALSYNNLADADAAFSLVAEFSKPALAIIKHANPCGVALGKTLAEAYKRAVSCDPVSAFGGIIAVNRALDEKTAQLITELFAEVVIAPELEEAARTLLAAKKNLRVLVTGGLPDKSRRSLTVKSLEGGLLVQECDWALPTPADLRVVTKRQPSKEELKDLLFAFTVAKHVKSNAVVYAKDGATLAIGAGQMSRVDSSRIAAWKAGETLGPDSLKGAVVASDAFFPFADGLLAAAKAGAVAVIQPGGSIRDDEVIAAADEAGLAMVFTGSRHFRH